MAKHLFSDRVTLLDEWVLIRVVDRKSEVLVPTVADGKIQSVKKGVSGVNTGIVVDVGPGRQAPDGTVVPIDKRISPGKTVCFFGGGQRGGTSLFRPPDFAQQMEEEDLYLIPANVIVFVLAPEGARQTVLA